MFQFPATNRRGVHAVLLEVFGNADSESERKNEKANAIRFGFLIKYTFYFFFVPVLYFFE